MKQGQIIFRFLFPTCQDAAKPVHPAVRSLYNPTTSFKTGLMFNRLCFFATRTNMSGITKFFYQISHLARIITFIKTHALFLPFSRLWSFYRNTFYSSFRHFAIMSISTINRQANRHSKTFSKQTAFNTFFGPVRRVWAGFFPLQAGPLSWRHPSTAMTSQYLLTHHNLLTPLSRVSEKFQLLPTPEIGSAPYCWNKYLFHSMHSIGSRFVIRKIFHPSLCGPVLSACRHQSDACLDALISMARFFSITRLKFYIGFLFFVFSSLNPFKGIIASDYIGYSGVIRIGSKFIAQLGARNVQQWADRLLGIIKRMLKTWRKGKRTKYFQKRLEDLKKLFLSSVMRPPDHPECRKIKKRFVGDGRDGYFLFLEVDGVEPTNNSTEQKIRFVVLDRRVTQGTNSDAGMRFYERMWTAVVASCICQGKNIFKFLTQSLRAYYANTQPPSILPATS